MKNHTVAAALANLDVIETERRAAWTKARAALVNAMRNLKSDAEREMLAPLLAAVDATIEEDLAELKTLRDNFLTNIHAIDLTIAAIKNNTLGVEN